ncbi:hypothetical protein ACFLSX_04890 [Calditrichota bacterium]
MQKFDFLIGSWDLEYRVPKSEFSEPATGTGFGTFKRALDDKYVYFDYSAEVAGKNGQAHGIFAWDKKAHVYRYWWFENSGKFMTATCHFVNYKTLLLNWHDTLLIQTFTKINLDKVILKMESPNSEGTYDLILKVIFTRKL